ncbi:hypothetical protein TNCV_2417121 [Trichonephila clavipes]|nr:hypothetical protein TNCV_2417121 [Trichonephila clavipes]
MHEPFQTIGSTNQEAPYQALKRKLCSASNSPPDMGLGTASGPYAEINDSTRGLLATDHVILKHGQVMWTTPELAPPSRVPEIKPENLHHRLRVPDLGHYTIVVTLAFPENNSEWL